MPFVLLILGGLSLAGLFVGLWGPSSFGGARSAELAPIAVTLLAATSALSLVSAFLIWRADHAELGQSGASQAAPRWCPPDRIDLSVAFWRDLAQQIDDSGIDEATLFALVERTSNLRTQEALRRLSETLIQHLASDIAVHIDEFKIDSPRGEGDAASLKDLLAEAEAGSLKVKEA